MASTIQIADSDELDNESVHTPEREDMKREPSQPHSILSHRFRESPQRRDREKSGSTDSIAIMVPPPARPWEYKPYRGDTTVDSVQAEVEGSDGELEYKIEYEDGKRATVSLDSHHFAQVSASRPLAMCLHFQGGSRNADIFLLDVIYRRASSMDIIQMWHRKEQEFTVSSAVTRQHLHFALPIVKTLATLFQYFRTTFRLNSLSWLLRF
jgi:hypothetical protein